MQIKNIIFDNGGVLSDPRTGHWFITTNFWKILNLDQNTNIDNMKSIMKKYIHLLTQDPKTEKEEYEMFSDFYYYVLKEFKYNNLSKEITNELASDCVYNDDKYIFYDDVDKELDNLSKKYNLYMITDAWPSSYRVLDNEDISKYFKSIMVSSIESKIKTDGLFEIFLDKNKNVVPEESIFIDDRRVILDKAKECNFNVLQMDRNYEIKDSKYIIIHELKEVEKYLEDI